MSAAADAGTPTSREFGSRYASPVAPAAERIRGRVWAEPTPVAERRLRWHSRSPRREPPQLRRKIEPDPTRPRYLLTAPGVGYRLVGA